jgi:hypothetical protein
MYIRHPRTAIIARGPRRCQKAEAQIAPDTLVPTYYSLEDFLAKVLAATGTRTLICRLLVLHHLLAGA